MLKLFKYLKKYWIALICVVALLYIQAQSVLALPDYMSKIVTYGIQSGGIDSNVPKMLSKDTFENALIFMADSDAIYVKEQYNYVAFNDITDADVPYAIDLSDKSVVKDTGVYVLKDVDAEVSSKLSGLLSYPILLESGIQATLKGDASLGGAAQSEDLKAVINNLPVGMSIFDALRMGPKENVTKMVDGAKTQFEAMGESTVVLAGSSAVKTEYTALGIDTGAIQSNYILNTGLLMMAVAIAGAIAAIMVGYFSSRIAAGVARTMRRDIFDKVETFSSTEFDKFSTASLITRTTNDIKQIQDALVMILRMVIYAPIIAVGAIIRVLSSAYSMTWIIALVVGVILVIIGCTFAILGPNFKKIQSLIDRLNLLVREQLTGMLVIRAFRTERTEEKRFDVANNDITKVNMFIARTFSTLMPIVMFIMNSTMLLIIWVGSHEVDLGNMQIGDMMAFMQYAIQIIMAFMMIAMVSIMIPRAAVASKRAFEVLETPLSIFDPKEPKEFDGLKRGYVEFKDVSFKYPNAEENVLTNISFVAKPAQTTAFIGSTGSGKSTIINLVPRFFDVSSGSVEIDGIDIREVRQKDLRDRIGLVPQKGILFAGDIASNIKYSDANMSDETMEEAARISQAQEFVESKEDKYHSIIAQGGDNVSGGQKQRVSIARALAKNAEVLIFDDSFSALDYKTDSIVRQNVNELCKKTQSTVLLVAQRVSSIMNADQIIVLEEGKIVGKGTHKELMQTCDIYKEIAYSQLSKEELDNE